MVSVTSSVSVSAIGAGERRERIEGVLDEMEGRKEARNARAARMLPLRRYLVGRSGGSVQGGDVMEGWDERKRAPEGKCAWRAAGSRPLRHHFAEQARAVAFACGKEVWLGKLVRTLCQPRHSAPETRHLTNGDDRGAPL